MTNTPPRRGASVAAPPPVSAPTLVECVERQAALTPDAVAVSCAGEALSYRDLNRSANRLAHCLRSLGVGPDSLVGIGLERSVAMVVGLLGILKSGGAYLPLDSAYPRERLDFMLADAGASVVLTSRTTREALPAHGGTLLFLDDEATIAGQPDSNPEPLAGPGNLAYVIYTSGSTGKPKGCLITHANVVRLFAQTQAWFGFGPNDVWTFFHSHAFDFSVWEIWGALVHGGRVVVVPYATTRSPDAFHALLVREGVTVLNQTPSAFRALIRADLASGVPPSALSLRYVIFGGEALDLQLLEPWFGRHGDESPRLVNMYGITETTVHVTYRPLARSDLTRNVGSVIGVPIPDLAVHLLDSDLQAVADGDVGEMFVAGGGVSRGYLNRPELTAQRFIDWASPSGGTVRLYRTGDLARRLLGGDLQYLGRTDHQVKIRGFRIETGEIESALQRHPGVRACAVVARTGGPDGEPRLVAYVVPSLSPAVPTGLRAHLSASLPDYMLPAAYVSLAALPLTENGKLDKQALPPPGRERPELVVAYEAPAGASEQRVCALFAELLGLDRVGRNDNFFELGGHSLLAAKVVTALNDANAALAITDFFGAPSAAALAVVLDHGAERALDPSRMGTLRDAASGNPIAIIAMAGRFPGAADVEAFWKNLCDGTESITRFAPEQLDPAVPAALSNDPAYVRARGLIDGVENFDAAFFGITPREAELMDPQQRIFLELCWECLERGGHVPDAHTAPVGVFAGMYNATYFRHHVQPHPELIAKLGEFQVMLGNEKDYIATRTAHKLNLTGPAVSVHTACSTSLVAICAAADALRAGQCRMALAGGVSVTCPPASGYLHQEGAMLSCDGHTRTFAADASGTLFSDGAAVVLLKRLADAEADGDPIHAVIRGSAINNDGATKASFTAPSSAGQAAVIAMALADAGVDARSISYVEAHGTATPVGDPIEIEGLTMAYRRDTQDCGYCAIGSLKSNVGHLVVAAGAAGVIKTALALSTHKLPPTLHAETVNPAIDFAHSPFVVNHHLREWRSESAPRRAGVSSFGVGGTNAHVILEEAPLRTASTSAQGPQLLLLSARTPAALAEARSRLAAHLAAAPDGNLADVAWTLAVGRKAFAQRAFVVADDVGDAVAKLGDASRAGSAQARDVVFMFPGQGAQYAGMGRALHASEPDFRVALDACAEILAGELGFDLRERLFADDADALRETRLTQPATFAIEYALARLWFARGIRPVALIGHSIGEFVAAVLADVMSLDDALRLVARRGRLMQALPAGAMLSVRMDAERLVARLPASLTLAAENAPDACVVSGEIADVESLRIALEADGIACRPLRTSHAFHSAMMDAVVEPFRAEVARVPLAAPKIPIASTLHGNWLDGADAASAEYWARHLRGTVRFARALTVLLETSPTAILLEVGPRTTLATLSRQIPSGRSRTAIASLADDARDERQAWLAAAGQLWCAGAPLDTAGLDHRGCRQRVRLPTYPFERTRHWIAAAVSATSASAPADVAQPTAIMPPPTVLELPMPPSPLAADRSANSPARRERLIAQIRALVEEVSGVEVDTADVGTSFIALGLDSLALTQLSLQLSKAFGAKITFRQLMEDLSSPEDLAMHIDRELPPEAAPAPVAAVSTPVAPSATADAALQGGLLQQVIAQQMLIMQQQLAMLGGGAPLAPVSVAANAAVGATAPAAASPSGAAPPASVGSAPTHDEEVALAHTTYDVKKAFGAIARIHSGQTELTARQRVRLAAFVDRYVARTRKSKEYTARCRAQLADPRVVNGFRPLLKEIVYQVVVDRSKGSRLWDLDGNEYIDALNGFGMNLFGWQPDFVLDAIRRQLDLGYEIGPQHPLAGEVAGLICEMTGFDRAAFCNTGSEAVMGTIRVARTVTGRETLVIFSGSYHGIFDEVIVRGTKKLKSVPAAPGILRNAAQNVLVLDYGTPESLAIIRQRAHEIAAVLVEPVQSRRPEFQPREFLVELRQVTREAGAVLIFDEVVTGFRAHPRGAQHVLGIDADLASYGKVIGGGYPIGVIAGKREYMDALDGGQWQFGDDSIPTVGVTYFAGTFVRHPLALAAAKAALEHLKTAGPALQERLNARTAEMVAGMNRFCAEAGAPVTVTHFASVWRIGFNEDHPLQDLLFAMMRSRGIHILEHFPCFFTTAHSEADIAAIAKAFRESIAELQEAEFLPRRRTATTLDAGKPPVAGARLGKDPEGRPAWYVPDPGQPGKYMKVEA